MAEPMSAGEFKQALVNEGLTVVEVGDWRSHNRNHKGPWGPVHGVMIHHTVTRGTADTVRICRDGHSRLPGPLCHGVITKDGRVHLVGYGRANHAGSGDHDVLRAVVAEKALPPDDRADTDGNSHFYGFECENLGDGEDPWPAVQLDAIARAAAPQPPARLDRPLGHRPSGMAAGQGGPAGLHHAVDAGPGARAPEVSRPVRFATMRG